MGHDGFETLSMAWTKAGLLEAVKQVLAESNILFDDMRKKIADYPELRKMFYAILFNGRSFLYNADNYIIDIGTMFGYFKNNNGLVAITNRVFETRLYNLFISEEVLNSVTYEAAAYARNQFVKNGCLDVDLIMIKFVEHFKDVYGDSDEKFIEENGRRFFLLYLKPIINGTGNYYVEAKTRDMRRTDVMIDYRGKQYIIEMKIWHGEEYNKRGEEQLIDYLEAYHLDKEYLLSFNFNEKKAVGVKEVVINGKTIIEAVV